MLYREDMENARYLSVKEAASEAGVHVSTINRWLKEGRLARHTIRNRFVRIDAADLARLTTPQPARQDA